MGRDYRVNGMKLNPTWLLVAAVAGAVSVAAGATGSHAVGDMRAAAFLGTAAHYGMVHAAALVGLAALRPQFEGFAARLLAAAAWLFIAGLVLFSGGLILAALTGFAPAIQVVPLGGVAYILGWLALGIAAFKSFRQTNRTGA
jgi:uncharacterized membrane protein YgdD (TMEM256/DUF423 family)